MGRMDKGICEHLPSRFEHGSSMKALKMSRMSIPTCPCDPWPALRFGSWQVTRMSIETKQARFSHPPISWLHLVGLSLESFWRVTVVQLPLSCFHGIGGKNTLRRNDSAQIPLCNPLLHLFGAGQNTWEKVWFISKLLGWLWQLRYNIQQHSILSTKYCSPSPHSIATLVFIVTIIVMLTSYQSSLRCFYYIIPDSPFLQIHMHHDRPSGAADSPPGTQRAWRCVGDLWKVANDLNIRNIWSPSYTWSCWLRPGGLSLAELLGLRCLKWNKAYLWSFGLGGKKRTKCLLNSKKYAGHPGRLHNLLYTLKSNLIWWLASPVSFGTWQRIGT